MEKFIEQLKASVEDENNITMLVVAEIRTTLGELGMSKTYRDRFVAYSDVNITGKYTPEQEARIVACARNMTTIFYNKFRDLEYRDDALAIMGKNFQFHIEG